MLRKREQCTVHKNHKKKYSCKTLKKTYIDKKEKSQEKTYQLKTL